MRRAAVIDRRATAADEFVAADSARLEVVFQAGVVNGRVTGVFIEITVADEAPHRDPMVEVTHDVAEVEQERGHADVISVYRGAGRRRT